MKALISLLIYPPYPYTSLPLHFFTHATPLYSLTPVNTRYPCYVLSVSSMLSVSCAYVCRSSRLCYAMLCCSSRASISCVYLLRLSRASVLFMLLVLVRLVCAVRLVCSARLASSRLCCSRCSSRSSCSSCSYYPLSGSTLSIHSKRSTLITT